MFVNQKGSGTQAIVGIIILVIGIGVGQVLKNDLVAYISVAVGVAIIISSFLIIIRQYERAIVLRLGKYQIQVGPGIQKRIFELPIAPESNAVDLAGFIEAPEINDKKNMSKPTMPPIAIPPKPFSPFV